MTPRRIVLTIIGLLLFGTAYSAYDRLLGWIDGLPLLPARMLTPSTNTFRLPPRPTSPTIERLKEAFGDHSKETEPAFYPTQLEFRNGETSTVVAAGRPPSNPRSKRVQLTPFSVAVFSKPRPEYLRQPGEVNEISTFHSDKAVLEFDKIIMTPTDMSSAKLVRLELISDPEQTLPDPRMGLVHITNNQRSSDPNRRLLLKTIGPVFYRDSKALAARFKLTDQSFAALQKAKVPEAVLAKLNPLKNNEFAREDFVGEIANVLSSDETKQFQNLILDQASVSGTQPQFGPDIWTDSPIEGIDHSNIPYREGTAATTAPTVSEEVRNTTVVADILSGQRLPPPTVTAVGMRVYLTPEDTGKPQAKKGTGGFSGIRRIELLEKVTMHLWMEGGQGLVGSEGKSSTIPESPPAVAGVVGGLVPATYAIRELGRDLLQIETRGPFAYDAEKNLARFDVLPQADPNLTNDVRATKIPPRSPGIQTLFSQVLELEFNGSQTDTPEQQPAKPAKPVQAATTPGKDAPSSTGSGPQFKRLHAWTYTPGRFLTISSDADQMEAYGQDLVRVQATETTRLTGSPLYAVQQRSTLTAGSTSTAGVLISEPCPGAKGPERRTTILGPGQIKLYDPATKTNNLAAAWQTSMIQTKERVGDRELDLYTFTDGAKLEDVQSDYWLKGKIIKLWMIPSAPGEGGSTKTATSPTSPTSRSLLHRLVAEGDVTGHSADLDIDHTDHLVALFQDIPTPELAAPNPMSPGTGDAVTQPKEPGNPTGPQPPTAPEASSQPKEPEKPKPPMKIRARTIDTWVWRYPQPKPPVAPGTPPVPSTPAAPGENASAGGGMKYEMERAVCEGMVVCHQDPDDPAKPRGTDIIGSRVWINNTLGTPNGSRLTVFGWDFKSGEVHNEGTSLIGPKVIIDQLHNLAVIEGRGSLVMPANSDLTGADLNKPDANPKKPEQKSDPVVVHFRDGMKFEGTTKVAEFFGKVNASQGESWILCHMMRVIVDRPVYFTQANRPGASSRPTNSSTPPRPNGNPPAKGPNGQPAQGSNNPDDDKPKIDVVYCYPAPADSADSPQERLNEHVVFTQVDRDPETGKPIRRQQLTAQELTIRAQVKDESRGEPYRQVLADGPGVARIWAPESKDDDAGNGAAKQPGNVKPPPAEVEMKLTVIYFSGRMLAKDKGDVYKEATFLDNIHVINLPTDNPDLPIERHKLPPNAVKLDCTNKLVVWSHKNPRLPDEPATQFMHAYGNAFLQNEEYDGSGEVIRSEGKVVWFDGTGLVPARIKSRTKGNENAGQQIRLDRSINRVTVIKSLGGMLLDGNGGNDNSKNTTNPNPSNTPNPNNPSSNPSKGTTPNKN